MWEGCVRGSGCTVTLRYCIPAPPTRPHLPVSRPRPRLVSILSFRLRTPCSHLAQHLVQHAALSPHPTLLKPSPYLPHIPLSARILCSSPFIPINSTTTLFKHHRRPASRPRPPPPSFSPPAPLNLSAHHTFQGIFLLLLKCHRT